MADSDFLKPGDLAPVAGRYAEFDLFGSATGFVTTVEAGTKLPQSPLNFTWKLTPVSPTLRYRIRRRPARHSPQAPN